MAKYHEINYLRRKFDAKGFSLEYAWAKAYRGGWVTVLSPRPFGTFFMDFILFRPPFKFLSMSLCLGKGFQSRTQVSVT